MASSSSSSAGSSSYRWPGPSTTIRLFVDVVSSPAQQFADFVNETNPFLTLVPTPLTATHVVLDPTLPLINLPLRDHLDSLGRGIEIVTLEWVKQSMRADRTADVDEYRLAPTGGPGARELARQVNGKGKERERTRSVSDEGEPNGRKRARSSGVEIPHGAKRSRLSTTERDAPEVEGVGSSHDRSRSSSSVLPGEPAALSSGSSASVTVKANQRAYTEQDIADWCDIRIHHDHLSMEDQRQKFIDEHPGRTMKSVCGFLSRKEHVDRIEAKLADLSASLGIPVPASTLSRPSSSAFSRAVPDWTAEEDRDLVFCLATRGTAPASDAYRRFVAEFSPRRKDSSASSRFQFKRAQFEAAIAQFKADATAKAAAAAPRPPLPPPPPPPAPSPPPPSPAPARIPACLYKNALSNLLRNPAASRAPSRQPSPASPVVSVDDALAGLHAPPPATPSHAPTRRWPPRLHPLLPPKPSSAPTVESSISSLFEPFTNGSGSGSNGRPMPTVVMNATGPNPSQPSSPRIRRSPSPPLPSQSRPNPFAPLASTSHPATAKHASPQLVSQPTGVSAPTLADLKAFRVVGGRPPACLLPSASDPWCHLCGVVGARQYEKVTLQEDEGQEAKPRLERMCADCSVYMMERTAQVGLVPATHGAFGRGRKIRAKKADELFEAS